MTSSPTSTELCKDADSRWRRFCGRISRKYIANGISKKMISDGNGFDLVAASSVESMERSRSSRWNGLTADGRF
ncbi:unannotated protein [freshwater metagenome]|uniref:Unannotated protein n=1 Tax=freshwater metagenome TaxID=449393 RepID=A0A6J7C9G4_9ZZZZ